MNFMKILQITALFATSATLFNCGTISINSNPAGADIYLVSMGKSKGKLVGKTPYTSNAKSLADQAGTGQQSLVLLIEKRGYESQRYILPALTGGDLNIQVNLDNNRQSEAFQDTVKVVNYVLKAERAIIDKNFKEALDLSKEIKKINDYIPYAYEIDGTVYYLDGKLKQSAAAWERVLELEPDNLDAQRMLREIRGGPDTGLKKKKK